MWVGVAVIVIVVAVVVGLLLAGVIPGLHSSSGSGNGSPTATSYSESEPVARTAADHMGGTWTTFFAGGADSTTSVTLPNLTSQFLGSDCPLIDTPSTSPTLSAYTGAYSTGLMTGWIFGLYSTSPSALMILMVEDGQATLLGEVTASTCVGDFSDVTALTATSVVDSTTAAGAVASAAASFVSANPTASSSVVLTPGFSFSFGSYSETIYPDWIVTYSSCGVDATSGTGTQFNATVNATNGQVLGTTGPTSVSCGANGALGFPAGGGGALSSGPSPIPTSLRSLPRRVG